MAFSPKFNWTPHNPTMKKPRPLCTVLGGPGGHVGVIFRNATNPTMKKPRFTKCGFFVFWPLGAIVYCFGGPWRAWWGHLQECHEPNDEKNTFYKVWFFRFLGIIGSLVFLDSQPALWFRSLRFHGFFLL